MLINIGIIVLLGVIASAMIYSVDRDAKFKRNRSFKTSKLKYTGGNN